MATYKTLEEIKTGIQTDLFGDDLIELRPEQREAIDLAKEHFCNRSGRKPDYQYTVLPEYRQFLWNAKMRFGKTICALQLAREMDVKRTLIVTHRPVVGDSWLGAFRQVFGSKSSTPIVKGNSDLHNVYGFGARSESDNVGSFTDLEKFVETEGNHYVFFVSMQFIRLSELVNAKTLAKNIEKSQEDLFGHSSTKENEKLKANILNTDWDLVVIDEAHEGTRTALGESVIKDFLKKEKTKMLHLSGTPFNLYEDFEKEEIFTWDYISEQQAKLQWEIDHPGIKNPYADLPKLNIFTYDITRNIEQVLDQTGIFTFNEFFRTWTGNPKADRAIMPDGAKGRFVHEDEVIKFLDLLCTKDDDNNFPFSTDEYRKMFRHTLWVVSHIDEAKALETLLNEHRIFKRFTIKNVAGNVETDEQKETALDVVKNAIGEMPERTSTITISCGRLTTGVTVEPWTAVLYLKGGDRAATYMQTIFRVQSPYKTDDGKMKTSCFVFDFAPDRTLKIVAETAKFSSLTKKDKKKKEEEGEEDKTQEMRDKETVQKFVDLCPVINMAGGKMSPLDVNDIYKQLENVFIDRLVRKGFDDPCLYVQEELNKVNPEILNHIGEHGGQAPDEKRKDAKEIVDLSHMTPEQRAAWEAMIAKKKAVAEEKAKAKARKDEEFKAKWEAMSEEEREKWLQEEAEKAARREKAKQEREEFKKRITNIRGIALRIPLLMYGGADAGNNTDDITVENFTRKIKDESWAEFMPKGITKEDFNKIKNCFNATRFMEAGRKYRALTRDADYMHVEERIKQITEIFSYFRNPDKETVLTPWRVVNMHMSDTLGGWCFYDETFDEKNGQIVKPRFVNQGDVTKSLFDNVDAGGEVQTKILEINSKTGLYPLYITYSLYRRRLEEYIKAECINLETVSVQEEQVVWDDIVADNIFVICNTPMAMGITRRTLFGFRSIEKKANIKSDKLIERALEDQEALIEDIKTIGFWKGNTSKKEMKFNAIIGNPPYQEMNGGGGGSSDPIYNKFVGISKKINPDYLSFIIPARWTVGGRYLDEFRDDMINDKHISKFYDFFDPKDIFPQVAIEGGICYFLRGQNEGECEIHTKWGDGTIHNSNRYLKHVFKQDDNEIALDVFVRDEQAVSIIEKVLRKEGFIPFSSHVKPRNYYKLDSMPPEATDTINNIGIWGLDRTKNRVMKFISSYKVPNNDFDMDMLTKWKVFVSKADGAAGQLCYPVPARIIGATMRGGNNIISTITFLVIGPFESEVEAINVQKYMTTKFFRFLLGVRKLKNVYWKNFSFIPYLDFTKEWNDDELYREFGLSEKEKTHIESMIKEFDNELMLF